MNCSNKLRLPVIESQYPLGWKRSSTSLNYKPFFTCKLNFIKISVSSREREYIAFKGTGQMPALEGGILRPKKTKEKLGALVFESKDYKILMLML